MDAIGGKKRCRLDLIHYSISGAVARRLAPDRIDAAVRTPLVGAFHKFVVNDCFREIDRLRTTGLSHGETLGHFVNRDDPARSEEQCGTYCELAHGAAPPN